MAVASFLVTKAARRDLESIYDFIQVKSPRAAEQFIVRLYGTFAAIARMPGIGRMSRVQSGRRVFPVGRYGSTIVSLGQRDWSTSFGFGTAAASAVAHSLVTFQKRPA